MSGEESNGKTILKPGQVIRPNLTSEGAVILLSDLFGLSAESVEELNSYDDKNFFVRPNPSVNTNKFIQTIDSNGYVLKILNAMDSQKKHVDAEHLAIAILNRNGFHCPQPVPNIYGEDKCIVKLPSTKATINDNNNKPSEEPYHMVRLLTYVPGQIFAKIPCTAEMLFKVGKYVAQLQQALQSFSHPALVAHSTIWDMRSVPKLKDFVFAINDDSNRNLILEIIDAFSSHVEPFYSNFHKGIIHGDFNEQNILVQPMKDSEPPSYDLYGMIDFGDMTENYYVLEVAMAITYMMFESKIVDPMLAGGHVLAGYVTVMPLNEAEFNVLKYCVASRFAQSLTLGAYTYLMDPGNEYVLTTAASGWKLLQQFWSITAEELYSGWKNVMRTYA